MSKTKIPKRLPDAINCSVTKEFTQIPNDLLRNPQITAKSKTIICILLSNQSGKWTSYKTQIIHYMKEGQSSIDNALKELETFGYLTRLSYVDKTTKQKQGSFWAYTDQPFIFDITHQLKKMDELGLELWEGNKPYMEKPDMEKKPRMENPDMALPDMANQALKILIYKNTNNKDKNNKDKSVATSDSKLSANERNKQFIPIAKVLATIISQNRNMKITNGTITRWSNSIRKLHEQNDYSIKRIKKALIWYKSNIGGDFVPVIHSGKSLYDKFAKLEDAMKRDGIRTEHKKPTPDSDYGDGTFDGLDEEQIRAIRGW